MSESFLEKLLGFYHINYEEYLSLTKDVSLDNFATGHKFDQMEDAVKLVKEICDKHVVVVILVDKFDIAKDNNHVQHSCKTDRSHFAFVQSL